METQKEYHDREVREAIRAESELAKQPLTDRKEARAELLQAAAEIIIERVEWLLNGSYGYGALELAKQAIADNQRNRRNNVRARLFIQIAGLEWRCSARFACEVWNKTPLEKQTVINAGIDAAIAQYLEESVA